MATQSSVIYGINSSGGLGEVLNYDKALRNLGLEPEDLSRIGRIAGTNNGITRDDFYTLSGSTENLYAKISRKYFGVTDMPATAEKTAGAFRISSIVNQNSTGVGGNLIVNGPIAAPAIRFFSTELLNTAGDDFEPLDISTSRVSSWSRSGNNISYGGSLLIDSLGEGKNYNGATAATSNSPALGVGSIIVDENEGLTKITPREFSAEQATHKLKTKINGKTYFMYAMKNIPLRFDGNFVGKTSGPIVTIDTVDTTNPDYRVIFGDNNVTQLDNKELTFTSFASGKKTIEIYVAPANLKSLIASSLSLENFPRADYTGLETLTFNNNLLATMPNFKSIAPSLKTLNLSFNPLSDSPIGSKKSVNRLTQTLLDRLPRGSNPTDAVGVTNLNLSTCFNEEVTGNFRRTFPNLTTFTLSGSSGKRLTGKMPEVGTKVTTYTAENQRFIEVPGTAVIKTFHDTPASGLDFDATGSNHGGAKLTLRRLKDRFEVEINSPGGATIYDAYGDGITRNEIQGNVLNGVTGAASPEGIPFGTLIVQTSGGVVTNANFSPIGSYSETHPSIAAPTHTEILTAGRAFSLENNLLNKFNYDTPFRDAGYYKDAGLFSNLMSITNLNLGGDGSLSCINNRNHAFINKPLSGTEHKSYNTNLTTIDFEALEGCGIPFFNGYTKLSSVDLRRVEPVNPATINSNLNKKIGAGKFDPATKDEVVEMMTLVDSPAGTQPGTARVYKFSGCTELTTLNVNSARIVGRFPKFVGNDKLRTIDLQKVYMWDHESSTSDEPFGLPHDQFTTAALDTVKDFRFIRSRGFYNNSTFGYSINTLTGPARQIFSTTSALWGPERYNPAPFQKDSDGKTCIDKLKKMTHFRWQSNSTKGPVPTFDDNEAKLSWLYIPANQFGKDYPSFTNSSGVTVPAVSGGSFEDWRVPSVRTSLKYIYMHYNNITGSVNFQQMANADSATQDDMTNLRTFYMDRNNLKKIDNWGHTSLPLLDQIWMRDAFRDNTSTSDNYYDSSNPASDHTDGHLIPAFTNKLPRIRKVYISERAGVGRGPFKGFADAQNDNLFEGCTRLRILDLQGNKFTKGAILEVLRSLKNAGLSNVTVNFTKQLGSDSEGKINFSNDSIADNDLIQSCKEAPFRFSLIGISNKNVPPAPQPPSTFTHAYTTSGFSSRVTGNTANLGSISGVAWNSATAIEGRLTLSGFATGTDKIIVTKVQSAVTGGAVKSVSTITSGISGTITIDDTITIAGTTTDINTEDSSWVEGAVQSIEYIVQAEGVRGLGNPKTIQLSFSNVTVT